MDVPLKKKQLIYAVRAEKDKVKLAPNPNMMALHVGSQVYVRKDDILKIFCDYPALYSVRLASLVFGDEKMNGACMPDDNDPTLSPLNAEALDSIISKNSIYRRLHSTKKMFSSSSSRRASLQATEQKCFAKLRQKLDSDALEQKQTLKIYF